jgi:hypothetical protein
VVQVEKRKKELKGTILHEDGLVLDWFRFLHIAERRKESKGSRRESREERRKEQRIERRGEEREQRGEGAERRGERESR